MITRTYVTKRDCARLFVNDSFDFISSYLVTNQPDFGDCWNFSAWDFENDYGVEYADEPMWSTFFEIRDSWLLDFIDEHRDEVMQLGFTLISNEDGL